MCLNDDFSENISRHLYLEYRVVALMLLTDYLYCVERYFAGHNLLIIGGIGLRVKPVKGSIYFMDICACVLTIEA